MSNISFQAPLAKQEFRPGRANALPADHHAVTAYNMVRAMLIAASLPLAVSTASAASFNITGSSSSGQTLGSGSNQTGTIAQGASLTTSSSTVAVTVTGSGATLNNLGTISQTGSARAIYVGSTTGATGLTINNGSTNNNSALIQTADNDVIQVKASSASVTLNNYGSMISLNASQGGAQAVDFNNITSGTNIINNYAGALLEAFYADAVRPGVSGQVNNWGTIKSVSGTGSSSDGIDAQSNTGVTIVNYATGLIEGARHGITGGAADSSVSFTTAITNYAGGIIQGDDGSGINLDGFNANQTATVYNYGTITGNGITGDGDGIDVDGVVTIINTGLIQSLNAYSSSGTAYSEGITVGGGTITNSGTIQGLVATGSTNVLGRGITLAGNDITTGSLAGTREAIYANAVITNLSGGLIKGENDSAIVVDGPASGYTVTINNYAGATIQGGSSTYAAIRTGADNDTINNAGTIDGRSSGLAIDMGAGNNTLTITGGSASILGAINGGNGGNNTLTIDPGTGNNFSYAGSISNFATLSVQSGSVTFSGVSTYTGSTVLNGGTLTLAGIDRLATTSTLVLNGGTLAITNAAGSDAQTFASLTLSASSTIDLNSSSLTFSSLGSVASGTVLTILDYSANSTSYALRLLGDYTANPAFASLVSATTINGSAATYSYDGTYTDIEIAAVPEPTTYVMLIAGLGLLGAISRKKRIA
jgi:hypothetical protein